MFPELRELWLKMIGGLTDAIAAEIDRERAAGRAPEGADSRQLASMLAWTTERCLYVSGLDLPPSLGDAGEMVAVLTQMWLAVMYGDGVERQAAA